MFGEKYPDPVRVVSVCDTPIQDILKKPKEEIWKDYSIEFCGGTHLTNTKEAGAMVILSEEGIAKGIRRITAVSQDKAKEARNQARSFAERVKEVRKEVGKAGEADKEEEVTVSVERLGTNLLVVFLTLRSLLSSLRLRPSLEVSSSPRPRS